MSVSLVFFSGTSSMSRKRKSSQSGQSVRPPVVSPSNVERRMLELRLIFVIVIQLFCIVVQRLGLLQSAQLV